VNALPLLVVTLHRKRWASALLAACAVLGASALLLGCGGKSRDSGAAVEPQGGSASSVGGGGSGAAGVAGTAGTAAPAGMAGAGSESSTLSLDDVFPWFDVSGASRFPAAGEDVIVHLVSAGAPARASTSTHNVVDMLSWARSVEFSAKASAPVRLLVSAGHRQLSFDYFAELEAERPWPTVGVDIGPEWQQLSVSIADMRPPDTRSDDQPSFFLAFSVEHPAAFEVWIDDVQFLPAE
jgi:hypothetical protein